VGLCSLNIHEASFNIALCYLFLKDFQGAVKKLNALIQEAPKKYGKSFWLLRSMANAAAGNQAKAKADFEQASKVD